MSNKLQAYVGVQACGSLIYLNTHSSIRARSTFTSSFSLPLFISSSSSFFITFLSAPLALSCCPCHCSSCSVITRLRHSTYLRSTVVVKMEGLTFDLWSEVARSGHAPSVHSGFSRAELCARSVFGELKLRLCVFSASVFALFRVF